MSSAPASLHRDDPVGFRSATPLIFSIVVALVLLAAAVTKVLEWNQLASAAAGARETMGSDVAGPPAWKLLLPVAEAIIAAGIVVFHRRAWVWALTALMFGSLAGYVFLLMTRGAASCGCFGAYSPPPVVMFTVDVIIAIIAATLATRWWGYVNKRGAILTVAGVGSIAGAAVANATTEPPVDTAEIRPEQVLRQLSVMAPVMDISRDAPTYMVYIYQETCPACQQHYPGMRNFTDATANHPSIRGLLLEITDLENIAAEQGLELPIYAWGETPTTLIMRQGSVLERYGRTNTPKPKGVYERLTGESYEELLRDANLTIPGLSAASPEESVQTELIPTDFGPNADPNAVINPAADRAIDKRGLVAKLRALGRFDEIFNDETGGTRHFIYAHSTCGSCIDYRRYLLELQNSGIVADDALKFHTVMRDLLEDDGIAPDEWGGVHAALLFDAGVLLRWYGEDEITENLPLDLSEEFE